MVLLKGREIKRVRLELHIWFSNWKWGGKEILRIVPNILFVTNANYEKRVNRHSIVDLYNSSQASVLFPQPQCS